MRLRNGLGSTRCSDFLPTSVTSTFLPEPEFQGDGSAVDKYNIRRGVAAPSVRRGREPVSSSGSKTLTSTICGTTGYRAYLRWEKSYPGCQRFRTPELVKPEALHPSSINRRQVRKLEVEEPQPIAADRLRELTTPSPSFREASMQSLI
jgi:hypothetical protein